MAGDSQATKRRLLDAAYEEFAEHGIAGARVDRIAAAAKSNKAQIYHYFGSKDDLFDAVFEELVADTVRDTPLDPADLPGYAAGLMDRYERNPAVMRLATWYRLERAASRPVLTARVAANKNKVAKIAKAQRAGDLPATFAPADLLTLVTTIAAMWTTTTPEDDAVGGRRSRAHRRSVVIDSVRALLGA
jgi:AcrR family transcriptional regulator